MPDRNRIVLPGPSLRSVKTAKGEVLFVPEEWELLPPGDAGLTRRVKAATVTWTVQEKRGRKMWSRGLWAARAIIEAKRAELESERGTEKYARRRAGEVRRREDKQEDYVRSFAEAVKGFLAFAPVHGNLAQRVAEAVTRHATPVGSGTVARTQRIPLAKRAEAAVLAWMRHQATNYEELAIPRIKGKRREVRRELAQESRQLLDRYRRGQEIPTPCPLEKALQRSVSQSSQSA